jgi:hypothetical protein
MKAREFTREAKILTTELSAGRDKEKNIESYGKMYAAGRSSYCITGAALNGYTRWEENLSPDSKMDSVVLRCIKEYAKLFNGEEKDPEFDPAEALNTLRNGIIRQMEVLTGYTDFFAIHEFILNRKETQNEIMLSGEAPAVDVDLLIGKLEKYIFSEKDKAWVNSQIQLVLEQLPVRMTKQRFYDILSESLNLYKGGELSVAKGFADAVRGIAGLTGEALKEDDCPEEGIRAVFARLEEAKSRFRTVEYKTISADEVKALTDLVHEVAAEIESLSTDLMQLTEIINDLLALFLCFPIMDRAYLDDRFEAALSILFAPDENEDQLYLLEGAQEEVNEGLYYLGLSFDQVSKEMNPDVVRNLEKAAYLTSGSTFVDPEAMLALSENEQEMADESSLETVKNELITDFDGLFSGMEKELRRAVMARCFGYLPVFFNTKDEVTEYFRYTLEQCHDAGELATVSELLQMIMED